MFVAFVKVKSLLKVNTRKALCSSLTCTLFLKTKNLSHEFCQNIPLVVERFILKELPKITKVFDESNLVLNYMLAVL